MVDETEAATARTVTTSTVKHDVAVNIPVDEDDPDDNEGNPNDVLHAASMDEALDSIFVEAIPVGEAENSADSAADGLLPEAEQSLEVRKVQLDENEKKIERGMATFVEVGQALSFININRLYLPEYKNWDEYVEIRWGFTKQRAFQYMQAAHGHHKFTALLAGNRRLPKSERGMRELMRVPDDRVADVLDKLGSDAELTADRIIKVRKEVLPKKQASKAKRKPAIKIEAALKAVGLWTAFLAACDLALLTEQQRKDLQKAHKSAADKFTKLSIAA